jgi:hypothetical protein
MRVFIVKEILIDPVYFGMFLDANTAVNFVVQREEDVHLLDSIPVFFFSSKPVLVDPYSSLIGCAPLAFLGWLQGWPQNDCFLFATE